MYNLFKTLFIAFMLSVSLLSCNEVNNATYFGGEIQNPNSKYVFLLKDDQVIDTLLIDDNNRFFKKYNHLEPGLYTFKHEPEFQYIYFDKNDSLLIRLNTNSFDESLTFSGRGEGKNNFLIELFLKLQDDRGLVFDRVDLELDEFLLKIESSKNDIVKYYNKRKQHISWDETFDFYTKSMIDLYYYSLKEYYPMAHHVRTNHNLNKELPQDYYGFRQNIDFNNKLFTHFPPFMRYLTNYMSNIAHQKTEKFADDEDYLLKINLLKLNLTDTLFKNIETKRKLFSNIAYSYLSEDQDVEYNKTFIDNYIKITEDDAVDKDINTIGTHIVNLSKGNKLPQICLNNATGIKVNTEVFTQKALVFFWTSKHANHQMKTMSKMIELKENHPSYQLIAINLDQDQTEWLNQIKNMNTNDIIHFQACNKEEIVEKWVILKLQKTIILNNKGQIDHAFLNMYDPKFINYIN